MPPRFAARKRSVSCRILTVDSSPVRSGRALDLHSMTTATRCNDVRQGPQDTRPTMPTRRLRLFQHRRTAIQYRVKVRKRPSPTSS